MSEPSELRDIFHKNGLNYSQIVGDDSTVVSMSLESFNKALQEILDRILSELRRSIISGDYTKEVEQYHKRVAQKIKDMRNE